MRTRAELIERMIAEARKEIAEVSELPIPWPPTRIKWHRDTCNSIVQRLAALPDAPKVDSTVRDRAIAAEALVRRGFLDEGEIDNVLTHVNRYCPPTESDQTFLMNVDRELLRNRGLLREVARRAKTAGAFAIAPDPTDEWCDAIVDAVLAARSGR